MHNYFKIRRYREDFERIRDLMYEYWSKLPNQQLHQGQISYEDSEESAIVRKGIVHLLPYVNEGGDALGIAYVVQSYPAPVVGGPILPVNLYRSIIDPTLGHKTIERTMIVDTIERSISIARKSEKEAIIHWLCPWNWLIDGCALIIRLPFLILRSAGLPPKVEENIISQVIKVVSVIIIIGYVAYKGLKVDIGQLLKLIGF